MAFAGYGKGVFGRGASQAQTGGGSASKGRSAALTFGPQAQGLPVFRGPINPRRGPTALPPSAPTGAPPVGGPAGPTVPVPPPVEPGEPEPGIGGAGVMQGGPGENLTGPGALRSGLGNRIHPLNAIVLSALKSLY